MFANKINLETKISHLIFKQFDSENQNRLTFGDFIDYLNMLLNGTQKEKTRFIFDMITEKKTSEFTKTQLFHYYKILKNDDMEDFFDSEDSSEDENVFE